MDNSIEMLIECMVSRLDELQKGSEFVHLLNCTEPELQEEAVRLNAEINHLRTCLEGI